MLSVLLFAAAVFELSFATFNHDHTSLEPADYTFRGKVVCGVKKFPKIRDRAFVRLMENDPVTFDDVVDQARIGKDGNFTLQTVKEMGDWPTRKWELYLEFDFPCHEYNDAEDSMYAKELWYSPFVKADKANTGYYVTYTMLSDAENGNTVATIA
uniref:Uncharacterized protein n=1 Tax=Panagrolaimus sp. PS1159 TaxID=55785 RepID=A0AC35FKG1_9BILA